MTRIIAGFAGSLTLAVPRTGTRPTSERIREAVFSSLEAQDALDGARVLDLYAGSGALGLEAVSRGAVSAVLVERHGPAAAICRKNAAALRGRAAREAAPAVEVVQRPVQAYLETAAPAGRLFDLVLLDPPYDLPEADLTRDLALLTPVLAPDAVVVVERSTRAPAPTWPDDAVTWRSRVHGDTAVWTALPHTEPDEDEDDPAPVPL
jgi:16S rRNA (guanine966-N2)-methyltransferase